MPRLKNIINDKERKLQCVMTENSIVYKIPMGAENTNLGHYIEWEIVDNNLVFRFATKKDVAPACNDSVLSKLLVVEFN